MKKTTLMGLLTTFLIFSGCATKPHYVYKDGTVKDKPYTLGLDSGDFETAALKVTNSLLKSGALDKKDTTKYVVAIDQIINDTPQRIDTDMLIKKIRIAILKSGKAVVSSAIKVGTPDSTLTQTVRGLRSSDEVKQSTVAKKHSIVAPDMGLSGKIIQRNAKTTDGDQLVEYYFQLTLTMLESGLSVWEDEVVIGKVGSGKTVSW